MSGSHKRLFAGEYRTRARYPVTLARSLANAWRTGSQDRAKIRLALHRVQPRRKSIYVALLVAMELYNVDSMTAEAFIAFMKPTGKGEANEKENH